MSIQEKQDIDECSGKTIIFINVNGMNVSNKDKLIYEIVPFVKILQYFIENFLKPNINIMSTKYKAYIIKLILQ